LQEPEDEINDEISRDPPKADGKTGIRIVRRAGSAAGSGKSKS